MDAKARAQELQKQAKQLLEKMRVGARRAYVLELTGTPKSGKTTTLGMLQHFFKDSGFKVHTLRERAADCPILMKGHFFFNTWTTCTMLAEVLATLDTKVDLLILDRGFFDALIWLELQRTRCQVEHSEGKVFANFVLLDRWRSMVDLTLVMKATPKVALDREDKNLLLPHRGSMMNERALSEFNQAVDCTRKKYGHSFDMMTLDTSKSKGPHESTLDIIGDLLPRIEKWADSNILVVPRDRVERLFGRRNFLHRDEAVSAMKKLASFARGLSRYDAEQRNDLVQLVVCGIPVRKDRGIFVFQRSASDEKSSQYGQTILWKGRHIENGGQLSLKRSISLLNSRLQEELHLKVQFQPEFLGLAWDKDGSNLGQSGSDSSRHLGVMFRVPLKDPVAQTLQDKEFRKAGRGHAQVGRFLPQSEIVQSVDLLDLEPWSKHIVENVNVEISR